MLTFGASYDAAAACAAPTPDRAVAPEDGLLILYTSGTTGLFKGALISQRALVARTMINCIGVFVRLHLVGEALLPCSERRAP